MIIKNNKELKQKEFKNEKELQNYFESNLDSILHYQFIETEFTVANFRIDTLAFDPESKSFRIIEYKNVKNHSLVDQGYTYLKLLLERKADFVLKYNEKKNCNLKIRDINWSQSRIIFVSPTYTIHQLSAADFRDIPIDLIKVTKYTEDIIDIDFIAKTSNVSIQELKSGSSQRTVNKEIKVFTEEDHFYGISDEIRNLYEMLKMQILELGDIYIDIKQVYIAFKGRTNICDIIVYKSKLIVQLNVKKDILNDPNHIARDIASVGHLGNGDYQVEIKSEKDIDHIMPLIEQSFKINKK